MDRPLTLACGLCVFLAGICTGDDALHNAVVIMMLESVFVAGWLLVRLTGTDSAKRPLLPGRSTLLLFLAWVVSVGLSLLFSPYGLTGESSAVNRYLQVIMHIVFGWAVYDMMRHDLRSRTWLLWILPAIVLTIAGVFLHAWFDEKLHGLRAAHTWMHAPPLHAHIRHAGYQITAALAVSMAFFVALNSRVSMIVQALPMTIFWTFLFWCGGRASALASLVVLAGLLFLSKRKREPLVRLSGWMLGSAMLGLIIAECLAVFPWNGLLQGVVRSVPDALTMHEFNRAGTGRLLFWKTSLESLQGHFWLGLGPQGYDFMPNRVYGLHPHNMLIQFLVEWGLQGTILFMVLIVWLVRKGWLLAVRSNLEGFRLAAGAVILIMSLQGIADGTWYHPQPSMYLALAFASWLQPLDTHERAA